MPDPPERVKAVVKAANAVVLSWTPPRRSNGRITKYTVHVRQVLMGDRSSSPIVKGTVPATRLHYDIVDLNKDHTYEAWVTAATKVGAGRQSRTVPLAPSQLGRRSRDAERSQKPQNQGQPNPKIRRIKFSRSISDLP